MTDRSSSTGSSGAALPNRVRPELDVTDRLLMEMLEAEGRVTFRELAARLDLAPSTVHARVQRLIRLEVITGFGAVIQDRERRNLESLVYVELRAAFQRDLDRFMAFVRQLTPVQSAFAIAGRWDFLLHIAVADGDELRTFVGTTLGDHPQVTDTSTQLVFSSLLSPRVRSLQEGGSA